jgi:caffeoyl-CoA O-methyltransferase
MHFLPEEIESYCEAHTSEESASLAALTRETWQTVVMPRMSSGHYQGRVLSAISKMIRPKRILEIGAFTGYSAWCMSEGLAPKGELITIEVNDELKRFHTKYAEKMPQGHQVHFIYGKALEIIPTLNKSFDLVFIDADKENYIAYYEMVLEKVEIGGWILIDNVLWSGKVVEPIAPNDKETKILVELNKKIQDDPRVENVLLGIRDGLLMVRRIA